MDHTYINGISISPTLDMGDRINGIQLAPIALCGHNNGVVIAPLSMYSGTMNGFSFSLWNLQGEGNCIQMGGLNVNAVSCSPNPNATHYSGLAQIGVVCFTLENIPFQLGILNVAKNKIGGLQIGLWNKNDKRSLPFFNW